jgi:hypothetical protein
MKHSQWLPLVLLTLTVCYGWFQYERFLNFERGYIYDPTTGDIYEAELEPGFTPLAKWSYLNPIKNLPYFVSFRSGIEPSRRFNIGKERMGNGFRGKTRRDGKTLDRRKME